MTCPNCGFEAAEGCIICPECLKSIFGEGEAVSASAEKKPSKKKRNIIGIILIIIGILAVAAGIMLFFAGCAPSDTQNSVVTGGDNIGIDNELFAILDSLDESGAVSDSSLGLIDSTAFPYANSPIAGTWVMLEDFNDGYDDWDYISELTADGYVYEWYGDGLGYYEPLCTYEYKDGTIIYHYADHDSVYSCKINGASMITADSYGTECEYLKLSDEINLSAEEVKALYAAA